MKAWPRPHVPAVPGDGIPLRLHDTAEAAVTEVTPEGTATLYVCGVTPYDTTHMGHAATYVTFDLVHRALLAAGHDVRYVQNVTDIDDPLLERAERDGVDWQDLAADQIALFHDDMTALGVLPPHEYVGVVESMPQIVAAVQRLVDAGVTYSLPNEDADGEDVYLDTTVVPGLGTISHYPREEMLTLAAERGGDPDRPGKRDPLDPLLWRAERGGEPAWEAGALGRGRPGWHIECTAIAMEHLGSPVDVQGGGSDLIFPHHEMTAIQAHALTDAPFAGHYTHQGMVAYDGEKMSKSKGNLVRVSTLRAEGVDPMVIRLALLAHHYRSDWEWTDDVLAEAQDRHDRWLAALSVDGAPPADDTIAAIRAALADDLDTPAALAAVDAWCDRATMSERDPAAPGVLARALDALLGIRL
ncbi:cysteine--1-D-myo-inosityl 2-amino-2-deoxy-alpha-D-glucopyranoside ligase [Janibacter sp. GXQ6167]|uniref:cysteine--1-D-myo-inosityl 2-amino-2-deoxy-alpha-D-glucopyranoside ligase n=1 Tax=Janibacter sp. GXQ6167 TaxID=3240791 RepID=UPI0035260300